MIKDEIREDMRAKRRALSKDEVKIKSDEIRQMLLGVECVKQAQTICTFISAFKEPDTVEIIKELWEQDKKIVVTKIILTLFLYRDLHLTVTAEEWDLEKGITTDCLKAAKQ